jgi:acetylornithine deacetylase/succinyl-diaminopimelate desuccinylase-like protein
MPALRPLLVVIALAALGASACSTRFDVDGARAHARVVHQVNAGPRIPGTPGHAAIQKWIEDEIVRLGGTVERQDFVDTTLGRPLPLRNIIGRFGPSGGRRLLLCAHYDTRPFSDEDPDSTHRLDPVPGANDAGSGVAVLLEVAELLHRRAPPVGVDLVFFDGEDLGQPNDPDSYCLGSRGYAARLPVPGDPARPVAGFLFDLVGDRDLNIHPEGNSVRRASNLVEIVLAGARATGATHFQSEPRHELIDDHVPLLDAGLPTVDIIDFDYGAWHTHRDLPDQVSPESLAEVSRVAAWLVYRSPLARP